MSERGAVDPHWRLLDYVERTTDLVGVVDERSRVVYLNEAARKRLGVAVDAELSTADLFPPAAFARYYDEIRPALLRTSTWSGELPVFTASGEAVPMALCLVGGVGPGGEIAWLVTHGRELGEGSEAGASAGFTADDTDDEALDDAEQPDGRRRRAPDTRAHDVAVAVSHGQIVAYVEPVVDARTGADVGWQGLARWNHPSRGVVPAADFITAIAEHPTAPVIDLAVLRATARAVARAQRSDAPIGVYASCSRGLLDDPHLERYIAEIVDAHALAAAQVHVVVRPDVLGQPHGAMRNTLRMLHEHGFGLVLADLHGALDIDVLMELGFDELRLSREVVSRLPEDPAARRIAQGTVGAAHAIGMTVTAVGVESAAQHDLVIDTGCDLAIGFRYGKPRPAPA